MKNTDKLNSETLDIDGDQKLVPSVALNQVSVLVVEDALDNQFLIRRFLEKEGAHVDIANNGQQGVDQGLRGDYDLILMDIQMPILDGYKATARLRDAGCMIPIIAFTAHAAPTDKPNFLKVGFNDLLAKPVKKADLIAVIHQFKKNPHLEEELGSYDT